MKNQFTKGEIQYPYGELTVWKPHMDLVVKQELKFRPLDFFSIISKEWCLMWTNVGRKHLKAGGN